MTDQSRARLVEQLKRHEGVRLFPYTDTVGKLTIGVGRNLTDRGISEDEAGFLLENDIDLAVSGLLAAFPWFAGLDEVRQRVLADMAFNLGLPKLRKFTRTLAAIERGDYAAASDHMLASKWAKQVKSRAFTLSEMMLWGKDV